MLFINSALAGEMVATTENGNFQSFVGSLVPLLIFIVIFYFLLIRPQQKKQQEHEKEVANLKPNDKVLTIGGIYGTIKKVKEKSLMVEVADGVEIEILSDSVSLIKDEKEKTAKETKETKEKEKKTKNTKIKKTKEK